MAPAATLYSVAASNPEHRFDDRRYLQEAPALTNALISNNSWNYGGDNAYDLAAASYDAAVRDALPEVTGSQPVLFVFAAGNDGNGDDTTAAAAQPDTHFVAGHGQKRHHRRRLEQFRNITNEVTNASTAQPTSALPGSRRPTPAITWPDYSSRGNVGIGTEGTYGRFKPDVVAPGTFIVSTRSQQWDERAVFINPTNYSYSTFADQVVKPNSPE